VLLAASFYLLRQDLLRVESARQWYEGLEHAAGIKRY
jgi:hypothetical protein